MLESRDIEVHGLNGDEKKIAATGIKLGSSSSWRVGRETDGCCCCIDPLNMLMKLQIPQTAGTFVDSRGTVRL
jgi:hypothetical protein